jgi:hypothetical protein
LLIQQARAQESQRQAQQGLGKNIISAQVGDHRFVAVGNRVHYAKNWKTFTDFLMDYLRNVLGREWGNAELAKPDEADMHPVIQWYRHVCRLQQQHAGKPGEIFSAPETGAVRAFNELAYNLYLLEHNVELRARLVGRLKHPDQFAGALTEIRVAGMLIRAGFAISYEDEDDRRRSHCEYTAIHKETGKSFSVEVKTRTWGTYPADDEAGRRVVTIATRRLLRAALAKTADHERVVFIELDMPDTATTDATEPWYLQTAFDGVRHAESNAAARGSPLPAAYVIVANHPYRHHLDSQQFRVGLVAEGVGPSDFSGQWRGTIREALQKREKHKHFLALWHSIEKHRVIPTTFDGSNPHLAFSDEPNRFQIGSRYMLPDPNGGEVEGLLTEAMVSSAEPKFTGVFSLADGRQVISSVEMTEAEWRAYREHPDTFFGIEKKTGGLKNPLDLYDFLFDSYKHTPREKLLEFLAGAADLEQLRSLPQPELASIYCERMTYATMAASPGPKPATPPPGATA